MCADADDADSVTDDDADDETDDDADDKGFIFSTGSFIVLAADRHEVLCRSCGREVGLPNKTKCLGRSARLISNVYGNISQKAYESRIKIFDRDKCRRRQIFIADERTDRLPDKGVPKV